MKEEVIRQVITELIEEIKELGNEQKWFMLPWKTIIAELMSSRIQSQILRLKLPNLI